MGGLLTRSKASVPWLWEGHPSTLVLLLRGDGELSSVYQGQIRDAGNSVSSSFLWVQVWSWLTLWFVVLGSIVILSSIPWRRLQLITLLMSVFLKAFAPGEARQRVRVQWSESHVRSHPHAIDLWTFYPSHFTQGCFRKMRFLVLFPYPGFPGWEGENMAGYGGVNRGNIYDSHYLRQLRQHQLCCDSLLWWGEAERGYLYPGCSAMQKPITIKPHSWM